MGSKDVKQEKEYKMKPLDEMTDTPVVQTKEKARHKKAKQEKDK